MKTAFSIIPEEDHLEGLHLLIETGWYGISFAWYKKSPLDIYGILSYNFNDRISEKELAGNIEHILQKEPVFSNHFESVVISYNFKESMLVPGEYYNDNQNAAFLEEIYGRSFNSLVRSDIADKEPVIGQENNMHNIYRVPEEVHNILDKFFSGAREVHSTSCQVQHIGEQVLHCIIFHNTIKLLLFNKNGLQFVQQFNYKIPADVIYHLLNACDQYNIPATEVSLVLSGMIDADSNLYQELYKYFMNISFNNVPDEIFLSSGIKAFPLHFFSHLTALIKCAL